MTSKHWTQKTLYTTLIAIFCNILWGTAFPVLKIVYPIMNIAGDDIAQNIVFISFRFFMAAILLLFYALLTKLPLLKITKKDISMLIVLGLSSTTFQYFFFNIGVANTNGIKASILGQVGIFFSVIISHFIYKNDKVTPAKVFGLIFGFIGLVVVNLGKNTDGLLSFSLFSEGFMIIAGIVGAIAMILAKKIGSHLHPIIMTAWQMLFGSILLFFVGLGLGGRPSELVFTPISVMLLFYLALLSAVAFGLWYYILQFRKIGEISLFKFIVPITGSILTAIFVPNEELLLIHVIGLTFVCLGIVIVNTNKKTFFK
ncbi:MAG TPA: DMT family transporter [Epulopiscium sp.]|nr:DMT family transporter [Candidatus Epulonipiscium sp.]